MPVEQKTAKRPEAKEGGREEEEKRLGISTDPPGAGRLRSTKTGMPDTAAKSGAALNVSEHLGKKFRVVVAMDPPGAFFEWVAK